MQGTAELNQAFYRLKAGCVPFQITKGEPFVYFVVMSPDSDAAAAATGGSPAYPDEALAMEHVWFRLFVNLEDEGVDTATCDEGCGWGTELSNGAISGSVPGACAMYMADHHIMSTGATSCLAGTEVLSPTPSCTSNGTELLRRLEYSAAADYAGNPRQYDKILS